MFWTKVLTFLRPLLGPLLIISLLVMANLYLANIKQSQAAAELALKESQKREEFANKQLQNVLEINQDQSKVIGELRDQRAADAVIIQQLVDQFGKIDKRYAKQDTMIKELEKNNANVKSYLDAAVPPELRGMLNGAAGGTAQSSGSKN